MPRFTVLTARDGEDAGVEVYSGPLKLELLSPPHPGMQRHYDFIPVRRWTHDFELGFFLFSQVTYAGIVSAEEFDGLGRILLAFAPLHRFGVDMLEQSEMEVDSSERHFFLELPFEAFHVLGSNFL